MARFRHVVSALAIGGLIAIGQHPTVQPAAAAPRAPQQDHEAHHPAVDQAPVPQTQEMRMADMQGMMAEMKAADVRIDALVAKMNAATGEAKVDAIAELLTAMAGQRTTMRHGMTQMQGQMIGGMMQHMSPEMQKMMAECPMMKPTGTAK